MDFPGGRETRVPFNGSFYAWTFKCFVNPDFKHEHFFVGETTERRVRHAFDVAKKTWDPVPLPQLSEHLPDDVDTAAESQYFDDMQESQPLDYNPSPPKRRHISSELCETELFESETQLFFSRV